MINSAVHADLNDDERLFNGCNLLTVANQIHVMAYQYLHHYHRKRNQSLRATIDADRQLTDTVRLPVTI